jgi:hypothetical protein
MTSNLYISMREQNKYIGIGDAALWAIFVQEGSAFECMGVGCGINVCPDELLISPLSGYWDKWANGHKADSADSFWSLVA